MSQGRSQLLGAWGWENHPTFNDGNPYFMGPYKPLRTWVDEFITKKYGNNVSLDPSTHNPYKFRSLPSLKRSQRVKTP